MSIIIPLVYNDLYDYLVKPVLDDIQIRSIAIQLIRAVAYIHSKDIVHADIKIDNILIYNDRDCELRAGSS